MQEFKEFESLRRTEVVEPAESPLKVMEGWVRDKGLEFCVEKIEEWVGEDMILCLKRQAERFWQARICVRACVHGELA